MLASGSDTSHRCAPAACFIFNEPQASRCRVLQPSFLQPIQKFVWSDGHDLKGPATGKPGIHDLQGAGVPDLVFARHIISIMGEFPDALEIRALVPRQNCRVRLDCRFHLLGRSSACDAGNEKTPQISAGSKMKPLLALRPGARLREQAILCFAAQNHLCAVAPSEAFSRLNGLVEFGRLPIVGAGDIARRPIRADAMYAQHFGHS